MPQLTLPTATLNYSLTGSGPLLLTISGANGSLDIWRPLASHLSSHFTVCIYDRRGFSRSYLTGPQNYTPPHRLETDADDAAVLIKHLSPDSPAVVLGNSSGAIVALMLLVRHPHLLHTVVAHEPPSYPLLPSHLFNEISPTPEEVYSIYRAQGPIPAFRAFGEMCRFTAAEHAGMAYAFNPANNPSNPYIVGNLLYWFERELAVYPLHVFDVEEIAAQRGKVVLVNGRESEGEAPHVRANVCLAEKLEGVEVRRWAGRHLGFASDTEEFAGEMMGLMRERGMISG